MFYYKIFLSSSSLIYNICRYYSGHGILANIFLTFLKKK
jgi:hypothetical protein